MNFDRVLADLREQLRNLDMAIESLERLQNGSGVRQRSRPLSGVPSRAAIRKTAGDDGDGKKRG